MLDRIDYNVESVAVKAKDATKQMQKVQVKWLLVVYLLFTFRLMAIRVSYVMREDWMYAGKACALSFVCYDRRLDVRWESMCI